MESADGHRPFDVFHPQCPSRHVFDQVFSRWGILVLVGLADGPVRFGVLRRAVGGISERMLVQTLNVLTAEGLVARQEWNEKPPRVEYRLTESGRRISRGLEQVIADLYTELSLRQPAPKEHQ